MVACGRKSSSNWSAWECGSSNNGAFVGRIMERTESDTERERGNNTISDNTHYM
jgi:hypothetical protein